MQLGKSCRFFLYAWRSETALSTSFFFLSPQCSQFSWFSGTSDSALRCLLWHIFQPGLGFPSTAGIVTWSYWAASKTALLCSVASWETTVCDLQFAVLLGSTGLMAALSNHPIMLFCNKENRLPLALQKASILYHLPVNQPHPNLLTFSSSGLPIKIVLTPFCDSTLILLF